MNEFINALNQKNLEKIKLCPKSDLHNRCLGGLENSFIMNL